MKQKERRKLADKIAEAEIKLSQATDKADVKKYQEQIMRYSSQVLTMEDMVIIDELVQEKIKNFLT